jgi:hypothetical protein
MSAPRKWGLTFIVLNSTLIKRRIIQGPGERVFYFLLRKGNRGSDDDGNEVTTAQRLGHESSPPAPSSEGTKNNSHFAVDAG